jgi:hypothetical protein
MSPAKSRGIKPKADSFPQRHPGRKHRASAGVRPLSGGQRKQDQEQKKRAGWKPAVRGAKDESRPASAMATAGVARYESLRHPQARTIALCVSRCHANRGGLSDDGRQYFRAGAIAC